MHNNSFPYQFLYMYIYILGTFCTTSDFYRGLGGKSAGPWATPEIIGPSGLFKPYFVIVYERGEGGLI